MEQTTLSQHSETSWKTVLLEKITRFRKLFKYSEQEKTLVKLEYTKKLVENKLKNKSKTQKAYKKVKEAEQLFENGSFEEARSVLDEAERKAVLSDTRSLDTGFKAARIKRNFQVIPESEGDRKHLILKTVFEAEKLESPFTSNQVMRILDEAYEGSNGLQGLKREAQNLLESHSDIMVEECFAGENLYSYQKERE